MTSCRRVQRHSRPQKVRLERRLRKSDAFEILRRSRDVGMPVSGKDKNACVNKELNLKYNSETMKLFMMPKGLEGLSLTWFKGLL